MIQSILGLRVEWQVWRRRGAKCRVENNIYPLDSPNPSSLQLALKTNVVLINTSTTMGSIKMSKHSIILHICNIFLGLATESGASATSTSLLRLLYFVDFEPRSYI